MAKKGRKIEGLGYRQWQKRNNTAFSKLPRKQQKILKDRGYRNLGWDNVQKSWKLLNFSAPPSLFKYKLERGDIASAIEISLLESENAKQLAQKTRKRIDEGQAEIEAIADEALKRYKLA